MKTCLSLAICLIFMAGCRSAKPLQKAEFYRGEDIYSSSCSDCHDSGKGGALQLTDVRGWSLRRMEWKGLVDDHAIYGFIIVPPDGDRLKLSDQEVKDALYYMSTEIQSHER